MSNGISSQIPIIIKPSILIQDILLEFNKVYLTWTWIWKVLSKKEPKSIFTDGSMIDDSSGSSCTKQIGVAEML